MAIDVDAVRSETPGAGEVVHFNNAGAALMPDPVLSATVNHLRLEARIGGYEAKERSNAQIEHTYDALARLINCSRDEIAVVETATRAWDMVFYAVDFKAGDRILTSMAEYASNFISYLQVARRTGAEIVVVPNDKHGRLSTEALEELIDDRARLISVTHVPTNGGLVNPAAKIGRIARKHGILYLLDACQSVGQMVIDVETVGCDMLSATGRKYLRGPRGTAFLYVRKDLIESLEPPFLDVHAATWKSKNKYEVRPDARRFENWETYYAGKIGLGIAADYALKIGMDNIESRVKHLAEDLRKKLSDLPGVSVHDLGKRKCGIVSFSVKRRKPDDVERVLREHSINVSTSTVEGTRLDMEDRSLSEIVRASVHYYNTVEEIDRMCTVIRSELV